VNQISYFALWRHIAGYLETRHLLRSPANARHLLRSIEDAEAGKLTEHELIEEPQEKA